MRGDRPYEELVAEVRQKFTPHARGSTFSGRFPLRLSRVYPACAGIDRGQKAPEHLAKGLPRMRGDRP